MFKSIIPGLVSFETQTKKINGSYFMRNINFFKEIYKKEKFHYTLVANDDFIVPKQYDFRSEYYLKKNNFWFYERKIFFLTFKFKYNVEEKILYFNRIFKIIPFRIGGLIPIESHLSDLINIELFLNGLVNLRGFAFQFNKKNYCVMAPGNNGKTSFLNEIVKKGGKYICEDDLLIDFANMEVYPTANARMPKIFNRKTSSLLEKSLNNIDIIIEKQKIDKLFLVQNTTTEEYETHKKNLIEFLMLNSLYFLTDNLFIKSYLFEENLTNQFLHRLCALNAFHDYEFIQIRNYNFIDFIKNLK